MSQSGSRLQNSDAWRRLLAFHIQVLNVGGLYCSLVPNHELQCGQRRDFETCFVEQLIPHPPIEAFDKVILYWLPWCNVVPIDYVFKTPAQHHVTG